MKILHVAKNIPNKFKAENDIILVTIKKFKETCGADVSLIYPMEYVPNIPPFNFMKGKFFEKVHLESKFSYNDLNIDVFKYLRLPFASCTHLLLDYSSSLFFNNEIISRYNQQNYDVVHSHYILPDSLIIDALGIKTKKRVLTVRQGDINKMSVLNKNSSEYLLYLDCICKADVLLSPNYNIKIWIENNFPVKVLVVPHGCDINKETKDDLSQSNDVRIIISANLIARKNVDWAIRAVSEYKGTSNVTLFITGDGPELTALKKISPDNVEFLGKLTHEHNLNLFHNCDFFVLPSEKETFGRVYIEALSSGLPCIARKKTGLYGYPLDNAMIFVDTYDEFKESFNTLVDDRNLRRKMSKSAIFLAAKLFSWDSVLIQYNEIYRS